MNLLLESARNSHELTIPEEEARYLAETRLMITWLTTPTASRNEVWRYSPARMTPYPSSGRSYGSYGCFCGGAFLFLLGSGAGQKYRQYTRRGKNNGHGIDTIKRLDAYRIFRFIAAQPLRSCYYYWVCQSLSWEGC